MPDERGSIAGLVNNAGTSVTKNTYDEYGIPGSANQGRFQYTGQAWLPELGCYHYKARIYCPTLGRFLQVDPIGYAGGIALYAYALNDPIGYLDPGGTDVLAQLQLCNIKDKNGEPGIAQHAFLLLKDTATGEGWVSRGGPNPQYAGSLVDVTANNVVYNEKAGEYSKLNTTFQKAQVAYDYNQPDRQAVPGQSLTLIRGSTDEILEKLNKFNEAVDKSNILYSPLTDNSNAYAYTAYEVITGRDAPAGGPTGSDRDLTKKCSNVNRHLIHALEVFK